MPAANAAGGDEQLAAEALQLRLQVSGPSPLRTDQLGSRDLIVELLAHDRAVEARVAAAERMTELLGQRKGRIARLGGLVWMAEKPERPGQSAEAHDLRVLSVERDVRFVTHLGAACDRILQVTAGLPRNSPAQNEVTPRTYSPSTTSVGSLSRSPAASNATPSSLASANSSRKTAPTSVAIGPGGDAYLSINGTSAAIGQVVRVDLGGRHGNDGNEWGDD